MMGSEKQPTTSAASGGATHHHPPLATNTHTIDIESQTHTSTWTDNGPLSETPRSYSPNPLPTTTPGPLSNSDLKLRKGYSLLLSILLLNLAIPFTPLSWVLPLGAGTELADALVANLALACACFFHFRIASLDDVITVTFPSISTSFGDSRGRGRTVIRNGYVVSADALRGRGGWVWMPEYFWGVAGVETGVLVVMAWYRHGNGTGLESIAMFEMARRCVVVAVVAAAWYVGWSATPRADRMWAWGYVKEFWVWQVASRIFRGGWVGVMRFGGGRR
ncbi:hypothetical protein B0T19DRAFT_443513 [Cercophora scortea]|uniref:Uncharacterized protein n=1 Tax=Cercophora scortea TaxID=314031 RepID=A0AAE0IFP5_9PEZI|nr:hypothetical protein B0T19DRAFT_443513 [Cercophora scortea]